MKINKRDFLKITGLAVAGVSAAPALSAAAGIEDRVSKNPQALIAKRWAMVVDTRKCRPDCKGECITACHAVHNVPDFVTNPDPEINNPRHQIKWIWKDHYENTFDVPENEVRLLGQKIRNTPFITMCNHCDNPPCVRVCPTNATFKRKDGIVMMDYHRCIGCRFCMAACPFGSRSFNFEDPRPAIRKDRFNPEFPTRTKGVVEKCNFCAERLAQGLLPACVSACKQGVLSFGDLDDPDSVVARRLRENFTIKRKPALGTMPMVYYIV